ncbi:MAG TPA: hypothetical protein VGH92_14285 [Gaiellaceae bacterium]
MVRWHSASLKTAIALGALTSLLVGSGAGVRWGELSSIISSITSLF